MVNSENKMKNITTLLIAIIAFTLYSCEKQAGEGGTSTIMGRVLVKNYNSDFTIKLGEYYSPDIDVFIIYGKDSIYSDDFKTGLNGWYQFDYLNKGSYIIYTYSADSTREDPSDMIPVMDTVFISENNSTIILDDLIIFD